MIDLRSDTVTKPTEAMRHAIAQAIVGDAVIDTDPTVAELEQETADLLGMDAAVFMPSGTMTNQVAIRVHCDRGTQFLCDREAHIFRYEQAAYAQLSGLVALPIEGDRGMLHAEMLSEWVQQASDYTPGTALLCLENTHNRWGGRVLPQSEIDQVCRWAHQRDLATHLDGARLWNAAVATGLDLAEMVGGFDSVSICYSKGLGAPVGSALVGDADLIETARRTRKLFGGAMRQAGVIAAGALFALRHHRGRLIQDHDSARQLAEAATDTGVLMVRGQSVDTNIVILEIDPGWGTAAQFQNALREAGVDCLSLGEHAIRLVTHLDVTGGAIDQACEMLRRVAALKAAGRSVTTAKPSAETANSTVRVSKPTVRARKH